jgi:Tfp pilus assembly protein PilO
MEAILQRVPPRTVVLLMSALALTLVIALVSYVVWPQARAYRESLATLRLLEGVAAKGDSLQGEMSRLQDRVDTLNRQLHGDMVDLPKNQMESFVIGRLQEISWRNHVELLSVTPGLGDKVQVFEEVTFNVRVSGDYFDLYQWLQDLREELGYVVVQQFKLAAGPPADTARRVVATFTIVSYREAQDD